MNSFIMAWNPTNISNIPLLCSQPVPPDTGAQIVSTHATVTTEPSAVRMMESAGAAQAGLDSTVLNVSVPRTVHRKTLSPTGSLLVLQ